MEYTFPVTRTKSPKAKPDPKSLGFGKYYTDHMFIMEYDEGQGWHDGRIVPYGPLLLDPAAVTLHYAQMSFEGMNRRRSFRGCGKGCSRGRQGLGARCAGNFTVYKTIHHLA